MSAYCPLQFMQGNAPSLATSHPGSSPAGLKHLSREVPGSKLSRIREHSPSQDATLRDTAAFWIHSTSIIAFILSRLFKAVVSAGFHFRTSAIGGSVTRHARILCWMIIGSLPALDDRQMVAHTSGPRRSPSQLAQELIQELSPAGTDETLVPDANDGDLGPANSVKTLAVESEYDAQIMEYIIRLEPLTMPNPEYMINQPQLNWESRYRLIQWMYLVHDQLCSEPETLFLAINIVDRFLSMQIVDANKLRLLGAVSLFVAAKVEDTQIIAIDMLVDIAGGAFSSSDVIQGERRLLNILEWNLSYSCPLSFIPRVENSDHCSCSQCQDDEEDAETLGMFFCEVGVVDHSLMQVTPSMLAAAAVRLSRLALSMPSVSSSPLIPCTERDIATVVSAIIDCVLTRPRLHGVVLRKYQACDGRFFQTISTACAWMKASGISAGGDVEFARVGNGSMRNTHAECTPASRNIPGISGKSERLTAPRTSKSNSVL